MIDASGEVDFGWLEWVIGREVDGQEEDAALEWRVALRSVRKSLLLVVSLLHTGPMIVACQWN